MWSLATTKIAIHSYFKKREKFIALTRTDRTGAGRIITELEVTTSVTPTRLEFLHSFKRSGFCNTCLQMEKTVPKTMEVDIKNGLLKAATQHLAESTAVLWQNTLSGFTFFVLQDFRMETKWGGDHWHVPRTDHVLHSRVPVCKKLRPHWA